MFFSVFKTVVAESTNLKRKQSVCMLPCMDKVLQYSTVEAYFQDSNHQLQKEAYSSPDCREGGR